MDVATLIRKGFRRLNRAAGIGPVEVRIYDLAAEDSVANLSCPAGLTVALLPPHQISRLREVYNPSDLSESELEQTQRRQSHCYGAWLSGRLVHYSWVQTTGRHDIQEAGRRIDIKPGEFWIYDCRTTDSARGLGIYPYVLTFLSRQHLKSGCKKGVIYTTKANLASQRGILKAGFQQTETLRGLRIGRRYYPL